MSKRKWPVWTILSRVFRLTSAVTVHEHWTHAYMFSLFQKLSNHEKTCGRGKLLDGEVKVGGFLYKDDLYYYWFESRYWMCFCLTEPFNPRKIHLIPTRILSQIFDNGLGATELKVSRLDELLLNNMNTSLSDLDQSGAKLHIAASVTDITSKVWHNRTQYNSKTAFTFCRDQIVTRVITFLLWGQH